MEQQIPAKITSEAIEVIDGKPMRITTMETKMPVSAEIIQREINMIQGQINEMTKRLKDKQALLETLPKEEAKEVIEK